MISFTQRSNTEILLTKAADMAYEVRQQIKEEENLETLSGCYSADPGQASMDINERIPGIFRDTPGRLVARVTVYGNGNRRVERF